MRSPLAALAVVAALAGGDGRAQAYTPRPIWGTVYVDDDGDGALSSGDTRLEGVTVFFGTSHTAVTDARGEFRFEHAPGRPDVVWVRIPEGFEPAPVYGLTLPSVPSAHDLALVRRTQRGPCRFTAAADVHTGLPRVPERHLRAALRGMTSLAEPPCFYTLLGDITQDNGQWQYDRFRDAARDVRVPLVPVPGNHDWWDGGAAYRRNFGPPMYAFDIGGAHYVVLNDSATIDARLAFLALDDRDRDRRRPLIVFTHSPLQPEIARALGERGVTAVFSGHLHTNRSYDWGSFVEYAVQPLVMSGIDQTPGGYRVVTVGGDGEVAVDSRLTIEEPVLAIAHPLAGSPVRPGTVDVVVAAHTGADRPRVRARVGEGAWRELGRRGGWAYTGALELAASARLEVEALAGDRVIARRTVDVEVADDHGSPAVAGAWPRAGGDPEHRGAVEHGPAPPLRQLWARAVGDHVHAASPVVADGRVLVALAGFADGRTGGVVALDAHTGAELWRYRADAGVRNAPAVDGDVAVFIALDGVVHAVDLATGHRRWSYRLASGLDPLMHAAYASPVIDGGVVYAGIARELVALDLATGARRWSMAPVDQYGWWNVHATPVVVGGLLIGAYGRGGSGVIAVDTSTGEQVWQRKGPVTVAIEGSLVGFDGAVAFIGESSDLTVVDAATGKTRWQARLSDQILRYGQAVHGTPAYAGGVLYVPTMHGELIAVEPGRGVAWRVAAPVGPLATCHYRAGEASYPAGPVVVGDTVWIGGPDGVLDALDAATGERRFAIDLGAPVLASPAPAGDILYVATIDGVVHALVGAGRGDPEAAAVRAPVRHRTRQLVTVALVILAIFLVATSLIRSIRTA